MLYPQLMRGAGFEKPKFSKIFYSTNINNRINHIDCSDPANLLAVTASTTTVRSHGVAFDPLAGVLLHGTVFADLLLSLDVSVAGSPSELDRIGPNASLYNDFPFLIADTQSEELIFLSQSSTTLNFVDYSDPSVLAATGGTLSTGASTPSSMEADGSNGVLFVAWSTSLRSIDISNKAAPSIISTLTDSDFNGARFSGLDVQNGYLYGGSPNTDMFISVDISNPAAMVKADTLSATIYPNPRECVKDPKRNYVYCVCDDHFVSLNVSDPTSMSVADVVSASDAGNFILYDPESEVAYGFSGSKCTSFDCSDPTSISILDAVAVSNLSGRPVSDVPGPSSSHIYY